ncbi:MAG: DUF3786 domain-containing protein [Candidatus Syntrophonatronum acetioxidans]|uniref:DUF3786 domain-containing protein n=1 Tax=Candidatus Syntrophonatronum acetioxidans TaxID=1795816 RepID=A0A424YEL3_9FIRM|nr:MAG: DUF3786 domain-containing protein [Candidatus Syntrophonatronum acetioxidans]
MKNIYIPAYEKRDPKGYREALEFSRKALAKIDPPEMARKSGAFFQGDRFKLKSMGHYFSITYPQGIVTFENTELEPDFLVQVILINYLGRASDEPLTYKYITYRDLPGGGAFYNAFWQLAINPLKETFELNPGGLSVTAPYLGGEVIEDNSKAEVLFWFLPRVPLKYLVWGGDEEIEGRANILYDSSASLYLHTEDLAGAGHYLTMYIQELYKNYKSRGG